jgi:predicted Rossmann fold nucleotide-binding protein DprA/Smf involved in DNA uptake
LNALNWELINNYEKFDNINNLTIDEKKILYTINIEPKNFDEIQKETNLETQELLMMLTKLELGGRLEQIPGDRYLIIN